MQSGADTAQSDDFNAAASSSVPATADGKMAKGAGARCKHHRLADKQTHTLFRKRPPRAARFHIIHVINSRSSL